MWSEEIACSLATARLPAGYAVVQVIIRNSAKRVFMTRLATQVQHTP